MTLTWVVLASAIAGLLLGLALGWCLCKRQRKIPAVHGIPALDADTDRQIAVAAAQWALARGRPEAAGVLADKLRLAWALMHGGQIKQMRSRRGWPR